ncbi:RtcB family protein [Bacteroidetes/Chlorobi group bacterium ChocPot_Mid]|nr:MAG: RtcB family protein [Bacteroidetes/Chlorobi group bacterium ChocPot_Mid]
MIENLIEIKPNIWEIPQSEKMSVPARLYAEESMLGQIKNDKSLLQLRNVATLPGIQMYSLAMPDIHEGYGFPIGGVAATDLKNGVISPGGIGYDINCGVRLLKTKISLEDIKSKINLIAKEIYNQVPSGVGKAGKVKLSFNDLDKVLNNGCKWALKEGYATDNDLQFTESNGSLDSADSKAVSDYAKKRGFDQLGTMGAGNHFIEINFVADILDSETASCFGLSKGQIVIQIHTGSRGLGHQVATDYIKTMTSKVKDYGFDLPDRELSCVPIFSDTGQQYFAAMSSAANFAWVNRQIITWELRHAWKNIFGPFGGNLDLLYDVAHNIAKIEEHTINGKNKNVMVHRKGATRAFPPNHKDLPKEFKSAGQPVLIPGSMGTSSWVLAGQQGSMQQSFGSCCHGSGRLLSRTAAKKVASGEQIKSELNQKGIIVQTGSLKSLSEESPYAYKDVLSVVNIVEQTGIAKRVAKLIPLAVIKG